LDAVGSPYCKNVTIIGAEVDYAADDCRIIDRITSAGGVIPEFCTVCSVQGIKVTIIGANVYYAVGNSGRRTNSVASGETPDFVAVFAI
jgi:hypothetical protein